mmetsp:Transcript_145331/g.253632  ORF Transcript_145331/g.253632 Transcript_145331/m.253632 type:complete len:204 (+) Transcript_145331:76-687(+)
MRNMPKVTGILFTLLSWMAAADKIFHSKWQGKFEVTAQSGPDASAIRRALAQCLSIKEEQIVDGIKPISSLRRLQNQTTYEVTYEVSSPREKAEEIQTKMRALNATQLTEALADRGINVTGNFSASSHVTLNEIFEKDGEPAPVEMYSSTSGAAPAPAPSPLPEEESDNTAAIVGGVIGGLVGLGLIGGGAYFFIMRKQVAEA